MKLERRIGMKRRKLAKRIAILLSFGAFFTDTVLMAAAPILPDTKAPAERQPLVMETASGIPLVNITAPTAGGVSRNAYTDFNVPKEGAILNNSYRQSETQLAGWVQGNSGMAKGTAKIIVNEVTSANPTAMKGFLEVAGDRASVVIANPNGITVNGGGFINTNKAILTTGTPLYDGNGNLRSFHVDGGTVAFEGDGLEGRKADSVAILSRAIRLNAGLWANQLDLRTGVNEIDAETYEANPLDENEARGEKPEFALDSSALGGMYAGCIVFIGTEKGLGVNMQGTMTATEAMSLDNDGNLKVAGTMYSAGNVELRAENIENGNVIAAGKDLSLDAEENIQNKGTLGAGIDEGGNLTADGKLALSAGKTIGNVGHTILAGKNLQIRAETLSNTEGGELYSGGTLTAELTDSLANDKGTVNAVGNLELRAVKAITNEEGKISTGENAAVISAVLNNKNGTISADGNSKLEISGTFTNANGSVTANENVDITAGETALDGILAAGGNLTLRAGSSLSNENAGDGYGVTKADGNVTVTTEKDLVNAKNIEAGKTLTVTASGITNKDGAELSGKDITLTASASIKNEGLVSADDSSVISSDFVRNKGNGRIYGEDISIEAAALENRKEEALEEKLESEMKTLRSLEQELEDAFDADVTAFTGDAQKENYFSTIKELTGKYTAQLAAVEAVKTEMASQKSGTIAARDSLTIKGNTLLNRAEALLYSGGDMTITETQSITNRSADIKAQGNLTLAAPSLSNLNDEFSARRIWVDENGTENPEQIRIAEGPEAGKVFESSEFSSLGSGYGAYHNKGSQTPEPIYESAYVTVTQPEEGELEDGETFDESLVGQKVANYEWDDEIFTTLQVQSMDSARPETDEEAQKAWDEAYAQCLDALDAAITAHNAEAEKHNASLTTSGAESYAIHPYTIIRTTTYTSEENVETTRAGVITSGGNMEIAGSVTNTDSEITAGKTLTLTDGTVDNSGSKLNQEKKVTFGTTQSSWTYKRGWPHKSRRRAYGSRIFMTPQIENGNTEGLGISKEAGNTDQKPAGTDITQSMRDNVQESLNPFIDTNTNTPTTNAGQNAKDSLTLPEASIYHVNDESTAKYLIETDEAFTNKKNFLSSDYMYEQMKWAPDKVAKRLGDGFYEQELLRQQIVSLTGKRYLENYESDEEQYKALMDAGVLFAKEYNLTPGVALTKEQMAALTSDIVWLETVTVKVGGKNIDVIYPHVYLRQGEDMTLTKDGSLISAKTLIADTKDELRNTGTLLGDTVVVSAGNITNKGHIEGKSVDLSALRNLKNEGQILGGSRVSLSAGENVEIRSTVSHLANQDVLDTTAGIAVKDADGMLLISAGKNIELAGATLASLGENGSVILKAGNDIRLTTDKLTAKKDMTENADNYLRTYRSTETANEILAKGDMTIEAGRDFNARNTTVTSEGGKIAIRAGKELTITNGETESHDEYGLKYKERGFLSKKTTTIKTDDYHKALTQSVISGNEAELRSGNDTAVIASSVVGQQDVNLTAGGNISIDAAEQLDKSQYEKQVKKSGLLGGGGLGFTIGSEKRKDSYTEADKTQIGSTVGSVEGNVNIQSGKDAAVKASNIIAGKDISITGENVEIASKENLYHSEEKHEYKRSGLSVSLAGGAVDALTGIVSPLERASEVSDKRLAALYGYEAYKGIDSVRTAVKDKNPENKLKVGVNVSIGSASMKSESQTAFTEAQGSTVNAGKDVTVTTDKDLVIHGSDVSGENITLQVGGNLSITAAEETVAQNTKQTAKGGSLGVTFGGGMPLTVTGSLYSGKSTEDGTVVTHKASTVTAEEDLTLESGKDTEILGSKVSGEKVTANIGGDLNIESLQDRNDYDSQSHSAGASFEVNTTNGSTPARGGISQGKSDSNYRSVTEQAGIYAGSEGFDISVGKNTDLKGAVIASEAPAEKNNLTTGTLTWSDVKNEADYKADGAGVTYATKNHALNERGLTPSITPTAKDDASSTTKSGVAEGKIAVTDREKQRQDIEELNRDTSNTLNYLAEIYNREDVEARQEFVNFVAKEANAAVHHIAESHGWIDGSEEKVLLHTIVGGTLGELSGNGFSSGALAGGVNEYVIGQLVREKGEKWLSGHADFVQWVSIAVGSAVNTAVGKDMFTGGKIAEFGTKWNELLAELVDPNKEILVVYTPINLEQGPLAGHVGFIVPRKDGGYTVVEYDSAGNYNGLDDITGYSWRKGAFQQGVIRQTEIQNEEDLQGYLNWRNKRTVTISYGMGSESLEIHSVVANVNASMANSEEHIEGNVIEYYPKEGSTWQKYHLVTNNCTLYTYRMLSLLMKENVVSGSIVPAWLFGEISNGYAYDGL